MYFLKVYAVVCDRDAYSDHIIYHSNMDTCEAERGCYNLLAGVTSFTSGETGNPPKKRRYGPADASAMVRSLSCWMQIEQMSILFLWSVKYMP